MARGKKKDANGSKIMKFIFPKMPGMPKKGPTISSTRRLAYWFAARLGDVQAIATGKPEKIGKRILNRIIGRNIVRRVYLKGHKPKKGGK